MLRFVLQAVGSWLKSSLGLRIKLWVKFLVTGTCGYVIALIAQWLDSALSRTQRTQRRGKSRRR